MQARTIPLSCGAADNALALADLVNAASIDPSNRQVAEALGSLRADMIIQKQKDAAMKGFLNKVSFESIEEMETDSKSTTR